MADKTCPFCSETVNAGAIICKHCKMDIAPGVCLDCHRKNRPEAKFCGYCGGNRLIEDPAKIEAARLAAGAEARARREAEEAGARVAREAAGAEAKAVREAEARLKTEQEAARAKIRAEADKTRRTKLFRAVFFVAAALIIIFGSYYLVNRANQEAVLAKLKKNTPANMSLIPAGEFRMGSPDSEGSADEHPRHKVHLNAYYMDMTEVTFGQYKKCMAAGKCAGAHVSDGTCYVWTGSTLEKGNLPNSFQGKEQPVVCVDWNQAKSYCKWAGKRLPTEAEWEKAARGGTNTKYSFGDDESKLGEYAWYSGNSGSETHPAGQKKPNQYGLYDMHGNVWEWVADWYAEGYYKNSPGRNPKGPPSGSYRGLRGGSWDGDHYDLRAAFRFRNTPVLRSFDYGFRCAVPAR